MTDDLIERMAMALHAAPGDTHPWTGCAEQDEFRLLARAALAALKQTHAIIERNPDTGMLVQDDME